ncbi:hypothetical protein ATJ97_1032 [Georgenia soli]|uniref:DUF1648 domain-containing protein n=1 Tax=Georgenia soli TaxID=638953 RepID=A0A2A9EJ57_9MICO|nr:hypothetical protein [Georgenia soli]PFG38551.1 hypothetical protein ATJ97_1032 [Georgenia soli]
MTTLASPSALPHRRRAWLLGVAVPLAVTTLAWTLVISWLPRLPRYVALHWGPGGIVDRVGSVAELLRTTAIVGGITVAVLAVLSLTVGRTALTRRTVLGLAAGTAVLFGGMLVTVVGIQVDAPDATAAAPPDLGLTVSVVAAVLVGIAAGALAGPDPELPATEPLPASAPRTPLAANERAVWIRTTGPSAALVHWGGVLLAVYIGLVAWTAVVAQSWFVAAVMFAVLPVVLTMLVWQVRVDTTGITARGALGWPRRHVPASEVVVARTRQVSPFNDFGGWGLRVAPDGTVGVVVRAGVAVDVERTGGRRLVVTVDDAPTGAALLNACAERARHAEDLPPG